MRFMTLHRFIFLSVFLSVSTAVFGITISEDAIQKIHEEIFKSPIDASYYSSLSAEDLKEAWEILKEFQIDAVPIDSPRLVLTGGAMASGKTTVFTRLQQLNIFDSKRSLLIDPDDAKKILMKRYLKRNPDGKKTLADFHRHSMYICDVIRDFSLQNKINFTYMTSLRYRPSAETLIEKVRTQYPQYEIGLIYVRAPKQKLVPRSELRAEKDKRRAPPELVLKSADEVEDSVWHLEGLVDHFMVISNDDDRDPVITLMSSHHGLFKPQVHLSSEKFDPSRVSLDVLRNFFEKEAVADLPETPIVSLLSDFDWTLSYTLMGHERVDPTSGLLLAHGNEKYRIVDGAPEFMEILSRHPMVRLSLISGGNQDRNEYALTKIFQSTDVSLFESLYPILSVQHLTEVDPQASRFSFRFKKDMRKAWKKTNPEYMGLIDDIVHFSLNDQSQNMIWLGRTFNFRETWADAPSGQRPEFEADSENAWALERNKLAYALGLILEALRLIEEKGITFRQALVELTFKDGIRLSREDPSQYYFYNIGAKAMREINPHWQKVDFPKIGIWGENCTKDLGSLPSLPAQPGARVVAM